MPIYEFYCPDNHRIYQFYAKTLAQGSRVPKCPDNPKFRMQKVVSRFAVTIAGRTEEPSEKESSVENDPLDARREAAMDEMEREFSSVDENDPKAMGRMMRRMAELSGEKIDGQMEEVVRKLEEGADPEALEEQMGGDDGGDADGGDEDGQGALPKEKREARARLRSRRPPTRDPKLYDYE